MLKNFFKLYKIKKVIYTICIISVMTMSIFTLSGCSENNSSDSSSSSSPKILTSSDAIKTIQTMRGLEYKVGLSKPVYKSYNPPVFGTCTADKRPDGSWDVVLNGTMTGYTDDYKDEFHKKRFTATAIVEEDGTVLKLEVQTK